MTNPTDHAEPTRTTSIARLLSQKHAAKILGVSPEKLKRLTLAGKIPYVQDTRGGLPWYRYSEPQLIAWLTTSENIDLTEGSVA